MRRGTWDSARLRPPCLLTVESRFVLHSGSLFSLYIFLCLNKNSVQQHIYIRISTSQPHTHNLVYIFSGLMGSHFHNFFFLLAIYQRYFYLKVVHLGLSHIFFCPVHDTSEHGQSKMKLTLLMDIWVVSKYCKESCPTHPYSCIFVCVCDTFYRIDPQKQNYWVRIHSFKFCYVDKLTFKRSH